MGSAFWGGGGSKRYYRVKADHSAIVKADGITPAVDKDDASLVIGESGEEIVESTDISYDENGVLTHKITHTKMDAEYIAFEEVACPKKANGTTVTKKERTSETGKKIGGGAASGGVPYLCVDHSGSNGTGRLTHISLGTFKKSSGGVSYKEGESVATNLEFVSIPPKLAISVAVALFDETLVAPVAPVVLPVDAYEKKAILPLPA